MKRLVTDPTLAPALAEAGVRTADDLLALAQPPDAHNVGARIRLHVAGTNGSFYCKAYRYPGWLKSKGLIGRGSLWGRAPCVREFRNLSWLRAQGVATPRAVAAASIKRAGRLVAHALLTEWVADAPNLAARLADSDDIVRTSAEAAERVMGHVGQAVGRMHAVGFGHHDLYARNILVPLEGSTTTGTPPALLLDCRRGRRASSVWMRRAEWAALRFELEPSLPAAAREALVSAYRTSRQRRRGPD